MPQVISTNVIALNAQRSLGSNSRAVATAVQRLSSGIRLNSAKDDAAGLAISERITSQIRGMDVAVRNANDGISLIQTAEGALSQVSSNLQRMRELWVQAINGTNSDSDRDMILAEVGQLREEIDRIARDTEFNGVKLLDGSFNGAIFQVGANAGQAISIGDIPSMATEEMTAQFTWAVIPPIPIAPTFSLPAFTITNSQGAKVEFDALTVAESSPVPQENRRAAIDALADHINAKCDQTGIIARPHSGAAIYLYSIVSGSTPISSSLSPFLSGGPRPPLSVADIAGITTDLGTFGVYAIESNRALSTLDKALERVSTARAELGAVQNRFTSTIANLNTTSENLSASRSRIRDTDYAKETAELTRTQILQQAGTAMLAQANSSTQNVLSLLG